MKNEQNQPMNQQETIQHETYCSGICNECYYYKTWHGEGYCDYYSRSISETNREKDCFTR